MVNLQKNFLKSNFLHSVTYLKLVKYENALHVDLNRDIVMLNCFNREKKVKNVQIFKSCVCELIVLNREFL